MISLKQYIAEADARSLIVVDIQPAYYPVSHKVLKGGGYLSRTYVHAADNIIDFINTRADRVLAYFNGSDSGLEDTIKDVQDHYLEMGLDPNKLDTINFQEKSYAFLRNWMDEVPLRIIIAVIRYMVQHRLSYSLELPEDVLIEIIGSSTKYPAHAYNEVERILSLDPLIIPDIDLGLLQQFSNAYISGGAKHECLKEITIMMNAFNIKYTLVKDFIY
tara:strand:- start:5186 stop:5839 length:654 start_codon:yes stop_codon:yes gene_type:complete